MRCFILLKVSLLCYLNLVADAVQIGQSSKNVAIIYRGGDGSDLNDRVSKLEAHNRHQDKEIGILQKEVEEERKTNHQLRDRVAKLEESNDPPKIIERPKRPVRLLPPHILHRNKTNYEAQPQFYGPATGHYLVNDQNNQSSSLSKYKQIEVVQCRFKKPPGESQTADDREKRLGFISMYESDNKDTCLYQLKNYKNACLVAVDRKKANGSNQYLGSVLRLVPCESITEKHEQWIRKVMHICSSGNNRCLTVSINLEEQHGSTISLTAYEESSTNQQWVMNFTTNQNGSYAQIISFASSIGFNSQICLFDPTDAYTSLEPSKKIYSGSKTKAVLLVQPCKVLSQEKYFSFEPIIEINNSKNCTVEYANYVKRNKKKTTII